MFLVIMVFYALGVMVVNQGRDRKKNKHSQPNFNRLLEKWSEGK